MSVCFPLALRPLRDLSSHVLGRLKYIVCNTFSSPAVSSYVIFSAACLFHFLFRASTSLFWYVKLSPPCMYSNFTLSGIVVGLLASDWSTITSSYCPMLRYQVHVCLLLCSWRYRVATWLQSLHDALQNYELINNKNDQLKIANITSLQPATSDV